MTLRVLGYSGSASGLNGSTSEPLSIEVFECLEAMSASGFEGSCSGNVSGFAGGAGTLGLTSELYLPMLADCRRCTGVTVGSELVVELSQLGIAMQLTGDVEVILRGARRGRSNLLYIKRK